MLWWDRYDCLDVGCQDRLQKALKVTWLANEVVGAQGVGDGEWQGPDQRLEQRRVPRDVVSGLQSHIFLEGSIRESTKVYWQT